MNEWWTESWLRRHVLAAPFGVFAATALLAYLYMPGQWQPGAFMQTAATFVDLGAVIYGMAAVVIERGIRLMFWALEQRKKMRKAFRDEIVAQTERDFIKRIGPRTRALGISDDELREAFKEVRSNYSSNGKDNE